MSRFLLFLIRQWASLTLRQSGSRLITRPSAITSRCTQATPLRVAGTHQAVLGSPVSGALVLIMKKPNLIFLSVFLLSACASFHEKEIYFSSDKERAEYYLSNCEQISEIAKFAMKSRVDGVKKTKVTKILRKKHNGKGFSVDKIAEMAYKVDVVEPTQYSNTIKTKCPEYWKSVLTSLSS